MSFRGLTEGAGSGRTSLGAKKARQAAPMCIRDAEVPKYPVRKGTLYPVASLKIKVEGGELSRW